MTAKHFAFVGLALVGAFVVWKHFTATTVTAQPLGGVLTDRPSLDPDTPAQGVAKDLIGGIPYGYTGKGAATTGDLLGMAGANTNAGDVDSFFIH